MTGSEPDETGDDEKEDSYNDSKENKQEEEIIESINLATKKLVHWNKHLTGENSDQSTLNYYIFSVKQFPDPESLVSFIFKIDIG